MEIINCCNGADRIRIKSVRVPRVLKITKPSSYSYSRVSAKSFFNSTRKVSLRSAFLNFNGRMIILSKRIKSVAKFSWLIPAFLVLVLLPAFGFKVWSIFENSADTSKISLGSTADPLDELMFNFAFDKDSCIDSEGNIVSLTGETVAKASSFKEPVSFQTYIVKSGDTLGGISLKFGLSNISTLISINSISNARALYVGQKLTVPSVDGLYHIVASNETLESISAKYKVSLTDIIDVNDLSSETLQKGQKLYIPGAKLSSESIQKALGEIFAKPIKIRYRLTSKFGPRKDPITGVSSYHKGIDLACATGTPIYASKSGTVMFTGWSSVYGYHVILKHSDGYQTLYGHMSKIIAKKGQTVNQDTKIGLVGNTGYSTGPHLHFTVYKNSVPIDPFTVLK
ncbi:MAG: peptidoglycan DD-metalloendopeptidase family protein [Treponema sp.]|nr:peptidoglycan DD-metalloendopeptidase family protein [Treponema sp.]